ncbi:MAG: InlB B-repeat-containing protein [Bacillus subtilis]|nr:InlB B-repeat-containing protein [Bacillus subtilis]
MPGQNITLYAKWTINSYTISFDSNGGSAVGSITQNYGTAVSAPTDPTKASYMFGGWYSDSGLTTQYAFTSMAASDITLYAKWNINSYTISFNSNGGSAVSSITQDAGTVVTEPADPTKTGYTFAGWYSDAGLTSAYTFTTMPGSNTALYAKWTINSYTISFEANGGSAVGSITQNYGTAVTQPGGSDEDGLSVRRLVQRRRTHFDLHVLDDAGRRHHIVCPMACERTDDQLPFQWRQRGRFDHAELRNGGQCAGGSDEDGLYVRRMVFGCRIDQFLHLHHDAGQRHHAVRQVDDQLLHDRNFNVNGGSAVGSISQNYATAVSAPADPTKTGYTFAGWYSDAGLTNAYTFTTMPAENITLYAKWTINRLYHHVQFQRRQRHRLDHAELQYGRQRAGGPDEDRLHLRRLVFRRRFDERLHLHHDAGAERHAVRQVDDQQLHDQLQRKRRIGGHVDHAELRYGSDSAGGSDEDRLYVRRLVLRMPD